jgi:hypothetical protein
LNFGFWIFCKVGTVYRWENLDFDICDSTHPTVIANLSNVDQTENPLIKRQGERIFPFSPRPSAYSHHARSND